MTHAFLSNEWIDAARGIREKYSDQVPEIPTAIKINLAILEVPFDENTVNAFFDTSSGGLRLELGELDDADTGERPCAARRTLRTDHRRPPCRRPVTSPWG